MVKEKTLEISIQLSIQPRLINHNFHLHSFKPSLTFPGQLYGKDQILFVVVAKLEKSRGKKLETDLKGKSI